MKDMVARVAEKLKALREESGLTVRQLAEELGLPRSTYANHESKRYKKTELPQSFAREVAKVLAKYGIHPGRIMALAGFPEGTPLDELGLAPAEEIHVVVTTRQKQLLDLLSRLSASDQEAVTRHAEALAQAVPLDKAG